MGEYITFLNLLTSNGYDAPFFVVRKSGNSPKKIQIHIEWCFVMQFPNAHLL